MAHLTFVSVVESKSWMASYALALAGSVCRLTCLAAFVALNAVPIDKCKSWGALNTFIAFRINADHTGRVTGMFSVATVIAHPLVHADASALAIVVGIFHTVFTVTC